VDLACGGRNSLNGRAGGRHQSTARRKQRRGIDRPNAARTVRARKKPPDIGRRRLKTDRPSGLFVRSRAVGARHGEVEQAQVDRKLSAVVDQVAHDEVPEHVRPVPLELQPAHDFQPPESRQGLVAWAPQGHNRRRAQFNGE